MVRHTPIESTEPQEAEPPMPVNPAPYDAAAHNSSPAHSKPVKPEAAVPFKLEPNVDLWVDEQIFEEDVRAVLRMMRPHSRERLQGWNEYRTGGAHYRVTVSWDDEFQITAPDDTLAVPHMADVIETLLVGSARNQDEMNTTDEFEQYRQVVREVYQRLEQRQACYE
jgi:hypothetical protein